MMQLIAQKVKKKCSLRHYKAFSFLSFPKSETALRHHITRSSRKKQLHCYYKPRKNTRSRITRKPEQQELEEKRISALSSALNISLHYTPSPLSLSTLSLRLPSIAAAVGHLTAWAASSIARRSSLARTHSEVFRTMLFFVVPHTHTHTYSEYI